ncbi:hypothetical protein ACWKSP_08740 [Micromonosporaceae bacterium Da 78-11]
MTSSPSDPWSISEPTAPLDPGLGQSPWVPSQPAPDGAGPVEFGAVAAGPIIVQIAEIAVTSTVVHTPAGDIPLAGSQWLVTDYWFTQQRTPKWAIIAAIAGFCVLTVLSLFFLLVKESVMQGTVQVTVTNGTRQYVARIPVTDQAAVTAINQQVNYVRTLAAL